MQCPRCGQWNDSRANICASCGTILPIIARSRQGAGFDGPLPPWLEDDNGPPPVGPTYPAVVPDRPPNVAYGEAGPWNDYGSWQGQGGSVLSYPPFVPDSVAMYPAPPWNAPFVPDDPMSMALAPVPFAPVVPMAPAVPEPIAARGDVLLPGTTLKSGRYSVVGPYVSYPGLQPQGNEPPLVVASDMELGGQRVLMQELPLASAWQEDADSLRRLIAQRFESLVNVIGVAKLVDHFAEQRRQYLVFELPGGELLLDRIRRAKGGIDETVAIGYTLQTLDVLASLEQQSPPFIHGNISPAHILLRPSGQVVLIGFSCTLLMHPDGVVEHGPAGGVPGYAPPEQARGNASIRADLFALCAVLHHAVTGAAPAPRSTTMHAPARRLNPRVSLELEDVLARGLRPSSTQRYHSVAELRAALQPLASGRRLTHVEEPRDAGPSAVLAPVRDARGRLVLPRRRVTQSPLFLLALVLALVALVGGGMLYVLSPHPNPATANPTPTPNDAAQLFQSKGIGLSGGEFIFDTTRPDNGAKQRGAQALAGGDLAGALAAFQSAQAGDQADAEAAIYAADVQILKQKSPYVTVIAAVAFADNDSTEAARSELQGMFLAQQHVNALDVLPGGLRVRVLVLNSGQTVDGATTAADVLLRQIQRGNAQHLAGIVGWPESEQTRLAISELEASGLAIVSPTATADHLGGAAGHFFAMTPSVSQQAAELADAAVTQMGANDLLVLSDPQDSVGSAAAASFVTQAKQYAAQSVVVRKATFTSGQAGSYVAAAHAATFAGDTLIFVAGSDEDTVYLAQAVQRLNATDGTLYHILAGSDAYTSALFGVDNSPVSQLARSNPAALTTVYLTSLADIRDFNALQLGSAGASTFGDPYAEQFGPSAQPSGLDAPDFTAILSYDAERVLLAAFAHDTHVSGSAVTYATPDQIRVRLLQFDSKSPFMGVGGAIEFSTTGSQPVKTLTIESLVPVAKPATGAPIAHTTVYQVVGDQGLFCGGAPCTPD